MPNPKRRHTKTRRDKRRTHWKLATASIATCPQCQQPKLPHRVCRSCGFYRGVEVVAPAEE